MIRRDRPAPGLSRDLRTFLVCTFLVISAASFGNTQPPADDKRKLLHGHVPPVVARLTPLGEVSGTTSLRVAIGLPLHNKPDLTNLLEELYDPASPNYHRYLTPDQFAERFGPTAAEYQAVIDFARSNNLTVLNTHPNRTVLDVQGTVADFENAFRVKLQWYPHPKENRRFLSPGTEPSVPADLPILDATLSNFVVPHPNHKRVPPANRTSPANVGSGPNNLGYMGADFRAAYVPGVTNAGTGQSVALVEFDGYYANDIYLYETNANISTNFPITNVLLNGFNGTPDSTQGADNGAEVTLDIEMVMSMAPGLSNLWVYQDVYPENVSMVPLGEVNSQLSQIATDNHASQISSSWIMAINETTEQTFKQFAAQGQSFFQASGDYGGDVGDIPTPSDDPYVTCVGGTTLTTSSAGGPWASEVVWQGSSGGGYSTVYPIQAWQQGVNMINNMGSSTMRNFPDVALPADNIFVVAKNGQLTTFYGTSAATPLWAAFTALVNQQAAATGKPAVGFLNPALYAISQSSSYQSDFHDITTGNNENGVVCFSEFLAVPGYDLCTGLGTPAGSNLINSLVASPDALQVASNTAFTASGAVAGPFNLTSQNYSLSNRSPSTVNWSLVNMPGWLQSSAAGGSLAGHGTLNVTVSLSAAAYAQGAGVYTATLWFTNLTSHFGQSRQFALRVGQPAVQNGGFETDDLSFWLLAGDDGSWDFVDDGTTSMFSPHSGRYCAVMGFPGLPYPTLTQTLLTVPGHAYTLSYWLTNPDIGGGTSPNEFVVIWNGTTLLDQVNVPTLNHWSNTLFRVTATGASSVLTFGARNDNANFGLDDVTLTVIPVLAFQSIQVANNTITLTWSTQRSQTYQVQYTSNLGQPVWNNLGVALTAGGTSASTTDTPTGTQRYYRVVQLP